MNNSSTQNTNEIPQCTYYLKRFKRFCKFSTFPNYNFCCRHIKHQKPLQALDKPEECQVCTEEFNDKDTPLACGHWIHKECVIKSGKSICPMCRFQLNLTKEEKRECLKNKNRLASVVQPYARIQTTLGAHIDALLHTYPNNVQQFIHEVGLHNILDVNVYTTNPLAFQCSLINYINSHIR